jgi:RNA-directed DNA polymerase
MKLERIGTLAASDTTLVFNNIGHILNVEMLREIYREQDGRKAIGIDGITKEEYGNNLDEKLRAVLLKIRKGTYKPQAARMVEIPKEDGSTRPLAISCFEDKLIQTAVSKILCAIFEPMFLPSSYGSRRGHDCHEALRALNQHTYRNQDGAVVEIDIRKYFNSVPHEELMKCLSNRISDRGFLRLVIALIKSPIMIDGQAVSNERGCPQGSATSPILANIYLHYVIDVWFAEISKTHMKSRAAEVRYVDDMVFIFEDKRDAARFYKVLPKRLNKFGLELHLDKSQLIESGNKAAARANSKGTRLEIYKFLGFVCYWGKARKGFWRLKYASRGDRFRATLKRFRDFLWRNLNTQNTNRLLSRVVKRVQGWINFHAISDNDGCVWKFIQRCKRTLFKWFNRRGGKRYMNWARFETILKVIRFPEAWKAKSMFSNILKQA